MKIVFGGRFATGVGAGKVRALEKLGHEVTPVEYNGNPQVYKDLMDNIPGKDVAIVWKYRGFHPVHVKELTDKIPTIYWYNDGTDHWSGRERRRARNATVMVHHSRLLAEQLSVPHVFEGYDPLFDYPRDVPKVRDVLFLGRIKNWHRREYKNTREFPFRRKATPEEHAIAVSETRINLNFTQPGLGGFSDRLFKIMAAGGFILTNECDEITDTFTPGEHLGTFQGVDDFSDKIDYYLNNPEERAAIAKKGMEFVRARFSTDHWAEGMIDIAKGII